MILLNHYKINLLIQVMFPYYLTDNNELLGQKLYSELEKYKNKFKDSTVYIAETKKEAISSKRSSQTSTFNDEKIRELVQNNVVPILNKDCNSCYFTVPNYHQDWVKYSVGGEFKIHTDFVKYHYKDMKTYTMLIGLKNTESGGETNLYLPYKKKRNKRQRRQRRKVTFSEGINPGGILCFQSDLLHSGSPVLRGEKEVLVLTLWAFKKTVYHDSNLLLIKTSDNHQYLVSKDLVKDTIFMSQSSFEDTSIIESKLSGDEVGNAINFISGNYSKIKRDSNLYDILGYTGVLCVDYSVQKEVDKIIFTLEKNDNIYMTDTFSDEFFQVVNLFDFIPFQVIIYNKYDSVFDPYYSDGEYTSTFIQVYIFNGMHWKTFDFNTKRHYSTYDIHDPNLLTHYPDMDIEDIMIKKINFCFDTRNVVNSINNFPKDDGTRHSLSRTGAGHHRFKVDIPKFDKYCNIILEKIINYCTINNLHSKKQFSKTQKTEGSYEMCNSIDSGFEYNEGEYVEVYQSLYYGCVAV